MEDQQRKIQDKKDRVRLAVEENRLLDTDLKRDALELQVSTRSHTQLIIRQNTSLFLIRFCTFLTSRSIRIAKLFFTRFLSLVIHCYANRSGNLVFWGFF